MPIRRVEHDPSNGVSQRKGGARDEGQEPAHAPPNSRDVGPGQPDRARGEPGSTDEVMGGALPGTVKSCACLSPAKLARGVIG